MSPAAGRGPGARRALGALLPVLLLVAGTYAFWEMRLSTRTDGYVLLVSSDLYNYFLPSYRYEAERLAAGAFPLWNPLQGVGQPFLATLQPGVLYPARLLLLVLTPLRALEVSLLAHVLLLVVSAYLLARALGASRLAASGAAWVAGTTIGGSWFYWPSYLEPAAWWPLLALALLRCIGGAGWRWPVLLGVAGAMPVLAGGYQVTLYMAYTLAILGAGLLADARFRPASWRGAAVRLAVAATIAVATAAPQLLPTLAWSGEAARRAAQVSDLQLDPLDLQPSPWAVVEHTLVSNGGVLPHYLSLPAAALALLGFARQRALGAVLGAGALLLFGIAL